LSSNILYGTEYVLSRQQLYDGELHGSDEVGETLVGEDFPRTEGTEPQCSHHTQRNAYAPPSLPSQWPTGVSAIAIAKTIWSPTG